MQVLHIVEQGAEVRVAGSMLTVWKDGRQVASARLPMLESIALHGAVQVSAAALARVLDQGIDCAFFTVHGRPRGRLETFSSAAGELRVEQALLATDPAARMEAIRRVITAKLASQARVLRALRASPETLSLWLATRLKDSSAADELRGIEGYATRRYFAALRARLPAQLGVWRREYPARDGVNALLGYGYAILRSRVHAAVALVGLDPYIGFLHPPGRGRLALCLDLMEEFRAPLVDYTCLRLLSRWGGDGWWSVEDGAARLGEQPKRELIAALEGRLAAQTLHGPSNQRCSWQRAIELQVRAFASLIRGEPSRYRPMR